MPSPVVKFEDFELDGCRYELRRGQSVVKLEKIPMDLLLLLVERGGELVTRGEIVERIWGKDVFVDTEHGINTAVRKIRNALADDPEDPRFVQTVTGKGYRFIAPITISVSGNGNNGRLAAAVEPPARETDSTGSDKPGVAIAPPVARGPVSGNSPRIAWRVAAVGFVVTLVVGALVGLNVRGVRDRFFPGRAKPRIKALAVLPLENLSADPNQEYFADGMTDEIITTLAKNPDLRVVSRTSVMQYKKVHRPLPEIARELGVDGILEGSIERSGNRVHINIQLVYAPQDRHLWAESYNRDLSDLASLQSELARTIARQVGLTASPNLPPERHISPEAHDAYMLGRYYWFGGHVAKGREYFLKAIQFQPDYAAAHAALADSYMAEVVMGARKAKLQAAMTRGEQEARQAIALDDSDGEAHLTMAAFHLLFAWNFQAAERESARAIELNPGYSEAHYMRANVLLALQRIDEAVDECRKSMEIDPRIHPEVLGDALLRNRQYDAAIAELRARAEVQPQGEGIHGVLATVYWQKGMLAESVHEMARDYVPESAAAMEAAFRRGGARGALEWRLAHWKMLQARFYISPLTFAETTARLGNKEETLRYLEQAYDEHIPTLVFIQSEPDFDFVHADSRYQAIVKKMGLPPGS